jgi:cytochrome c oxidase assembly protein subunit 17
MSLDRRESDMEGGAVVFESSSSRKFVIDLIGDQSNSDRLSESIFVKMQFGWFSGPSKPAPSPQADTSAAAKSNLVEKNCLIVDALNPEGIKPCCACPITKQKRDDCFMKSANGDVECQDLILAHRECECF